uniref:CD40 molecule n=1 Tax=Latimeria chalumnae TaxID=7897 RepID=H3A3C7_LATCH
MIQSSLSMLASDLLVWTLYSAPVSNCDEKEQYSKHDICCSLCPPGKRMVEECTISADTKCTKCGSGEYRSTWNKLMNCLVSSYCDPNLGFVTDFEGDATRNNVCKCKEGYCSTTQCETCITATLCAPGFGVKFCSLADGIKDTECEKCPPGKFSNSSSATESCQSWT